MMKRREKEIKRVLKRLEDYSREIKDGICRDILCHIVSRTLEVEIRSRISNFLGYYILPQDDITTTVAKLTSDGSLLLAHPDKYDNNNDCAVLYSIDELTSEEVIKLAFNVPQIFEILSEETLFDIKFLSDSARSFCDGLVSSEFATKVKHLEPFIAVKNERSEIAPPFRGARITEFVPTDTYVFQRGRNYCQGVPEYGTPRFKDDAIIRIAGEMIWSSSKYIVKCWNQINGEKRKTEYIVILGFPRLFSSYEDFDKS